MERAAERQAGQPDLASEPEPTPPPAAAMPAEQEPRVGKATALQKFEASAENASKGLSVTQKKAFLEVASRTDLDKLTDEQRRAALVAFGEHTGLRPELGELMVYQGRFYITMAGRVRNAHESGLLVGMYPQPANPFEKKNAGYEDDDIVWKCSVRRRGAQFPFVGWGKVTRAEIDKARGGQGSKFTPIAQHPVEMARKRAEYDALRLAFPIDERISTQAAQFIAAAEEEAAQVAARGGALRADAAELEDELHGRTEVPLAALGTGAAPEAVQQ